MRMLYTMTHVLVTLLFGLMYSYEHMRIYFQQAKVPSVVWVSKMVVATAKMLVPFILRR